MDYNRKLKPKEIIMGLIWGGISLIFVLNLCSKIDNYLNKTSYNSSPINYTQKFDGACKISARAILKRNTLEMPEIIITGTNNGHKTIKAIQFHLVPYNVYGEQLANILNENNFYLDYSVVPNGIISKKEVFLNKDIKTGKLFIYHVYYDDGTEWGDRKAPSSIIQQYGKEIEVMEL
ncbi:MAG: hypothetical protein IJW31_06580 [Lentisphaeria bacterium]|nr:hypothetical protein [Lentisphaeria bacterium]